MTQTEPTLAAPRPPSTTDFAAVFAQQTEDETRAAALHPANKDNLFAGLMAAGITHVTVIFDGHGDSGQIKSIAAWSGERAVDFPTARIAYAALTWDDPAVEIRELSLVDVVERLAYDFLKDLHGSLEHSDAAYGEFCFDAAARSIHLEFNVHEDVPRCPATTSNGGDVDA